MIDADAAGIDVRRRSPYDLWVVPSDAVVPLVVLVHGPVRGGPRPREWPVYRGYGSLLARAGVAAAIADLDYTTVESLSGPTGQLDAITDAARSEPGIDGTRAVIWAFSGGARSARSSVLRNGLNEAAPVRNSAKSRARAGTH